MKWFSKKHPVTKTKPTFYDIKPGDVVELRMIGLWDGNQVITKSGSYFMLGAGNRQVDSYVYVTKLENEHDNGGESNG